MSTGGVVPNTLVAMPPATGVEGGFDNLFKHLREYHFQVFEGLSLLFFYYLFFSVCCSVSVIVIVGVLQYSPTSSGSLHSLLEKRVKASFDRM